MRDSRADCANCCAFCISIRGLGALTTTVLTVALMSSTLCPVRSYCSLPVTSKASKENTAALRFAATCAYIYAADVCRMLVMLEVDVVDLCTVGGVLVSPPNTQENRGGGRGVSEKSLIPPHFLDHDAASDQLWVDSFQLPEACRNVVTLLGYPLLLHPQEAIIPQINNACAGDDASIVSVYFLIYCDLPLTAGLDPKQWTTSRAGVRWKMQVVQVPSHQLAPRRTHWY